MKAARCVWDLIISVLQTCSQTNLEKNIYSLLSHHFPCRVAPVQS